MGVLLAVTLAVTAGATTPSVRCPIKAGMPTGGGVQWAFGDSTSSFYVHGHGTWTNGRADGQICISRGSSTDVLTVAGSSRLQTATAGADVVLTLPVSVTQTSGSGCAAGAHGSVTLYAHYHVTGIDIARFHLTTACASRNHSYTGSGLHMLITRHGAQL